MHARTAELSFDDMLDVLGHVRRRQLLRALLVRDQRGDEPVIVGADEIGAEAGERFVEMRHVHLPKLVDYGVVAWDQEGREMSKGPNFAEIRPLLELLVAHEDGLPDDLL